MKMSNFLKCSLLFIFISLLLSDYVKSETIASSMEISTIKNSLVSANKNSNSNLFISAKKVTAFARESINRKKKDEKSDKKETYKIKDSNKNKNEASKEKDKEKTHNEKSNPPANDHQITSNNKNLENKKETTVATEIKPLQDKTKSVTDRTTATGFFSQTSKSNQSTAGKAFAGFIGGFLLLYLSIWLICRNERSSVVKSQFIDWIKEQKYINFNDSNGNKDLTEGQPIVIEGNIEFSEKPKIDGFDFDGQNPKTCLVIVEVEEFKIYDYTNDEDKTEQRHYWNSVNIPKKYGGKLCLDKVFIDLNANFEDYDPLYHSFNQEEYRGNIDALRQFVAKEFQIDTTYLEKNDKYFYFLSSNKTISGRDEECFENGDKRVNVKCYYFENKRNATIAGELRLKDLAYCLESCESPIKIPMPGCFFCCFDYGNETRKLFAFKPSLNKSQFLSELNDNNNCETKFCRIFLFFLHFAAYYLILYPFILLLGMIPFIGAITSFILILFAFIISVISFLFILIFSWIFARPLFAALLFVVWISFIIIGKLARDKYGNDGTEQNNNNNNQNNNSKRFLG